VTGLVYATGPGAEQGRSVMAVDVQGVVYECSSCGERGVERRCAECNVFCRRLGEGGRCPSCDEVVLVEELGVEA
jgi:predicted RNA-binding Zn-ribbon protein involved in translation (DUF1610 family)